MNVATKFVRQNPVKRPLTIGLVNNMGISAKTQFTQLLDATGRSTELVCFTMRTPQDEVHDHLPIAALLDRAVDAIIVTGMEITTSDLRDEWLWHKFTRLYDWCEQRSIPVIWSCLAAHAAVLYRDGITRQPLGAKLSGVFDCQRSNTSHRLTHALPTLWSCPHSRYNGLSSEILTARGYTILSCGEAIGVDIFTHQDKAMNFYFQGHPEYHAETLLHEFLRDLRRYVAGETSACPAIPATYLNTAIESDFAALRLEALAGHDIMPAIRARATYASFRRSWKDVAVQLYANWLDIVAEHTAHNHSWLPAVGVTPPAGAAIL